MILAVPPQPVKYCTTTDRQQPCYHRKIIHVTAQTPVCRLFALLKDMTRNGCPSSPFIVADWSAWAPGLAGKAAWKPWPPLTDLLNAAGNAPPLADMPAMMRRRLDAPGRLALQAAYDCQSPELPVIFASRHGELARSVGLLSELAATGAVSPTQFSLSVHNAMGALYSIARQDTRPYTALAAGSETVEAACIEACSLLAEGAPGVLVIYCEGRTPAPYEHLSGASALSFAWACQLRPAGDDEAGITLQSQYIPGIADAPASDLPEGLIALQFLTSEDREYCHACDQRLWRWMRHA